MSTGSKESNTCAYLHSGDLDDPYYDTECGNAICYEVGDLQENGYKYCPFCGRHIIEQQSLLSLVVNNEHD